VSAVSPKLKTSRDKEIKMTVCFECEYKNATDVWELPISNKTIALCESCAVLYEEDFGDLTWLQPIAD
jgi:hypothetical protein